jgi:outer membrane protein TolC
VKKATSLIGLALAALLVATSAAAQTLSLTDALARADRGAYANRIAAGAATTQEAQALAALRGVLPTIRLEGGYVRTTDPIGAFGTTLRQRRIGQDDFDPARLNRPSVASNYAGAMVIEQPLVNVDAHLGRLAAARIGDAAEASSLWTRQGTQLEVIRAYFGSVLAAERVTMLEAAVKAAQAHAAQAEKMVRAGLATRSDALLATVKAGEVETQLIEARGDAELAVQRLALVMGTPDDSTLAVPSRLPEGVTVRALLESPAQARNAEEREDLAAARLGLAAARYDAARARSLVLPRLNAFARYDWNSPTRLFEGDENWTVGVMATWTPFAGASEWAERRAAAGREATASAGLDAARAAAGLELESAESARRVALSRLEIAARGAEQSAEAHRIVTRKYEGGLATVLELLDAAAVETQAALSFAHARYAGIAAEAERRRALGLDPGELAITLETPSPGVLQ